MSVGGSELSVGRYLFADGARWRISGGGGVSRGAKITREVGAEVGRSLAESFGRTFFARPTGI